MRGNIWNASEEWHVEGVYEHYQDSNNLDNPIDDSREDDLNGGKKEKRNRREKYPRYLGNSIDKANLYVGLKFREKK